MKELPNKVYLRRGEVREYLGLSERAFSRVVKAGVLTELHFAGMEWAYYLREEVVKLKEQRAGSPAVRVRSECKGER